MTETMSLQDWLSTRGLTPQEADLWSSFIVDALELVDDGHLLLRQATEWIAFLGGCAGANPTEPEITSGLGDRMRRLRNEAPLDSGRDKVFVTYESPTPGDERHGNRKSKADFRFERKFEAGYAVAFVVEAKPLRAHHDIIRRYLAPEGLGCFLDRAPPYSRDIVVGMIGYAYNDPETWLDAISGHLAGSATRSGVVHLNDLRSTVVSDHLRDALNLAPATVLHTILDFA